MVVSGLAESSTTHDCTGKRTNEVRVNDEILIRSGNFESRKRHTLVVLDRWTPGSRTCIPDHARFVVM
ncbi:hypothetical protein EYF80_055576 [Liparis tanakae]|uniref:Uncharacterized protein n=1 Tax=Liparis tanakae TaxID=230148 RepID=A0A4Z2F1A5_9TELE|nr:hypothetical protein EYF80_055576 [Liparis tanakae]